MKGVGRFLSLDDNVLVMKGVGEVSYITPLYR